MDWTDIYDIAAELADQHPDVDPQYVRFHRPDAMGNGTGRL